MYKKISLAVLFVLSGCAGLAHKSSEEIVQRRAEQQMEALQALNFAKAYSFMTPGYREANSLRSFSGQNAGAANIVSFIVHSPSCSEDRCTVMIERTYKMAINARGQQGIVRDLVNNMQQVWIKSDGQWWIYGGK